MLSQEQDRDEKDRQDRDEHSDVLQLAPHDNGPIRVGRVMHNRPEKAARAQGEEKSKCEEPRITELLRIEHGTCAAKRQRDERDHAQDYRHTAKAAALKVFAFRRRRILQTLAHFFGASGLAGDLFSAGFASAGFASGGLFSAGFSKSARCSGGTSAIAAF